MSAQITVHRPRGIVPKIAVGRKTVVDYQPELVAARCSRDSSLAGEENRPYPGTTPRDLSTDRPDLAASPAGRRLRPTRVVVVPLGRLRHRPAAAGLPENTVSPTSSP